MDLLVEQVEAARRYGLPVGDRGRVEDADDLVEGQAGVLQHPYEDQPAQRRLCVAALASLAGVGGQEAAALVGAHGGGIHASAGSALPNRKLRLLNPTKNRRRECRARVGKNGEI